MALTKEDFVKEIETMSVSQLHELVETIKERFNVTGAVAVAAAAGDADAQEAAKSSFDVVLKETGANKIAVIKVIRTALNIGLIDAKKLAEEVGAVIKQALAKDEAQELKAKLEGAGAVIELK